jgi:hypothetical protein
MAQAQADDEAEGIPPLPSPACALTIGETVEIHGEKFRVRKITKKDVVLRSVRQ